MRAADVCPVPSITSPTAPTSHSCKIQAPDCSAAYTASCITQAWSTWGSTPPGCCRCSPIPRQHHRSEAPGGTAALIIRLCRHIPPHHRQAAPVTHRTRRHPGVHLPLGHPPRTPLSTALQPGAGGNRPPLCLPPALQRRGMPACPPGRRGCRTRSQRLLPLFANQRLGPRLAQEKLQI